MRRWPRRRRAGAGWVLPLHGADAGSAAFRGRLFLLRGRPGSRRGLEAVRGRIFHLFQPDSLLLESGFRHLEPSGRSGSTRRRPGGILLGAGDLEDVAALLAADLLAECLIWDGTGSLTSGASHTERHEATLLIAWRDVCESGEKKPLRRSYQGCPPDNREYFPSCLFAGGRTHPANWPFPLLSGTVGLFWIAHKDRPLDRNLKDDMNSPPSASPGLLRRWDR